MQQLRNRGGLQRQFQLAFFNLRPVEDVADDAQQAPAGIPCGPQRLFLIVVEWCQGQHLQHAQHATERRADLMAHGGKERVLGTIGQFRLFLGGDELQFRPLVFGDVLEQDAHPLVIFPTNAEGKHIVMPLHCAGRILETDGFAGAGHLAIDFEPVFLMVRNQFAYRLAQALLETGFLHEGRIGFHETVVDRFTGGVIDHLDHAEPFIHRFKQRAISFLAGLQCRLHCIFLSHIAEYQHCPDHLASTVADRRATVGDGVFAAITRNQHGIVGQAMNDTIGQNIGDRNGRRLACLEIDDAKNIGHREADGFLRPAGEPLGDGIQARHPACGVGDQYRIADGVERDGKVFLAGT